MPTPFPPLGAQLMIFGGHADLHTQAGEILDDVRAAGFTAVEGGARTAARWTSAACAAAGRT